MRQPLLRRRRIGLPRVRRQRLLQEEAVRAGRGVSVVRVGKVKGRSEK